MYRVTTSTGRCWAVHKLQTTRLRLASSSLSSILIPCTTFLWLCQNRQSSTLNLQIKGKITQTLLIHLAQDANIKHGSSFQQEIGFNNYCLFELFRHSISERYFANSPQFEENFVFCSTLQDNKQIGFRVK